MNFDTREQAKRYLSKMIKNHDDSFYISFSDEENAYSIFWRAAYNAHYLYIGGPGKRKWRLM
jgi:hypothetical protein